MLKQQINEVLLENVIMNKPIKGYVKTIVTQYGIFSVREMGAGTQFATSIGSRFEG